MSEGEFWQATPYITRLYCDAYVERERDAYRHDIYGAWHAGKYGRIKRLPSLSEEMKQADSKNGGRMSPSEILDRVKTANARFNGKVIRGGVDVTPLRRTVKAKARG